MNIKWIGCNPDNMRFGRSVGGFVYKPTAVVIHITDGPTIAGADAWFMMSLTDRRQAQPGAAPSAAHYCVAQDGSIHQYVKEENTAFHAGVIHQPTWGGLRPGVNPNAYTIGIEHAGHPGDAWTDLMYAASAELIHGICERWGIIATTETVVRHSTINALHGQCPGPNCDLDRLIRESRMDPE